MIKNGKSAFFYEYFTKVVQGMVNPVTGLWAFVAQNQTFPKQFSDRQGQPFFVTNKTIDSAG